MFLKKLFGEIEGFGLYVLRKGKGDSAGFGWGSQDADGFGKGSEDLLRAIDAIPVARYGAEAIVDGNVLRCG